MKREHDMEGAPHRVVPTLGGPRYWVLSTGFIVIADQGSAEENARALAEARRVAKIPLVLSLESSLLAREP